MLFKTRFFTILFDILVHEEFMLFLLIDLLRKIPMIIQILPTLYETND